MEDALKNKKLAWNLALAAVVLALYGWAVFGAKIEWSAFLSSAPHAADFLRRAFPPDLSVTGTALDALRATVQMALLGTTFGAALSLPLGMMAAKNLSPRWLYFAARGLLNLVRAVPSVVWGLFFVAAVGLGAVAGVLALTFYTVGYLGKFFYETFEAADDSAATALRSAGASPPQVFQYAILPQSAPLLLNYGLFMLEYNIRAATILGVVGAGGIGFYLLVYIQQFDYPKAATVLLILLAVVLLMDALSAWVRRTLVEPQTQPVVARSN